MINGMIEANTENGKQRSKLNIRFNWSLSLDPFFCRERFALCLISIADMQKPQKRIVFLRGRTHKFDFIFAQFFPYRRRRKSIPLGICMSIAMSVHMHTAHHWNENIERGGGGRWQNNQYFRNGETSKRSNSAAISAVNYAKWISKNPHLACEYTACECGNENFIYF